MSARAGALGLLVAAGVAAAADAPPASRAEKPEWTLRLEVAAPGGKGPPAAIVHLAARAGFHVNLEYPISFRPAQGPAGGAARVALRPATKVPCQGSPQDTCAITLELPLPAGGAAPVEGTLAFSVCTAERCLIEKVALSSAGAGAS